MKERVDCVRRVLVASAFMGVTLRFWLALGSLALFLSVISPADAQSNFTSFCRAILTQKRIVLSGGIVIDSFNSGDPALSTNGRYDPAKRRDHGDIASASDQIKTITASGGVEVYGHVATGSNGTVATSGGAALGSLAWVDGRGRGVQPGWYTNNVRESFPDVQLPPVVFLPMPATKGRVDGIAYTYVLTNGNYRGPLDFHLSGSQNMAIDGKVILYFPSKVHISGSAYIYITPGSSLTMYLGGESKVSGGGVVNGTGFAANCAYLGLPTCTKIENSGGSDFIGTIYAPQADVKLSGGGSAVVNFAGAMVANSANISGDYKFHYDESLCGPENPVVIVEPPNNQTNCPGATATFGVTATGTALTYQWFFGTNVLSGKTNSSLILNSIGASNAGIYCVVVNGASGGPITNCAALVVNQNVSIITSPAIQHSVVGGSATFSVVASGTALTYQWYFNGTPVGPDSSVLVLTNIAANQAGNYCVIVSGVCGNPVTNCTVLIIDNRVVIEDNVLGTPTPFQITRISQNVSGTTVEFTTATNCLYYLQHSDDLVHWQMLPGGINGTGNRVRYTEPETVPCRYYRVMVFR